MTALSALMSVFTECFTVYFTIAADTPKYNQYQAVFSPGVQLVKNQPGNEAYLDPESLKFIQIYCDICEKKGESIVN